MEIAAEIAVEITTEIAAEVVIELAAGGLGCRLQIQPIVPVVQARQGLGETSQRLSGTELVTKLVAELEARAEIRQLKELKILLIAVRCQNSLKS